MNRRPLWSWLAAFACLLTTAHAGADRGTENGRRSAPTLALTIDVRDSATAADIRIQFPRLTAERIVLALDDWGGLQQLSDGIDALQAEADGTPLPVQAVADGRWELRPGNASTITLRYRLRANVRHQSGDSRDHYRAIVTPDLFHAVGHNSLILPQHLAGPWQVELNWVLPSAWRAVSSLGQGNRAMQATMTAAELADSLLIAGPLRVLSRRVEGHPVTIAIHGTRWQFHDDELANRVQQVLAVQRAFMADDDFPHYLVSAIGVGAEIDNGYSLNGTRLHRSFALFMNPNATLKRDGEAGRALEALLMHETFHEWNGGQLASDASVPEGELYWFSEGWTNFYARKLLQRAGLRDRDDSLRAINTLLRDYQENPARDQANSVIPEQFWSSSAVHKLPYQRGDLFAIVADLAIRQASADRRSLNDVFFALLAASRAGQGLTSERIFTALSAELPAPTVARLRAFIEQGGSIEMLQALLPACVVVAPATFHAWQPGFDLDASLTSKIVQHLQTDSAAAQAGLREGDPLRGWSIRFNDPDTPIELHVAGRETPIRFLPRGASTRITQWQVAAADCPLLAP